MYKFQKTILLFVIAVLLTSCAAPATPLPTAIPTAAVLPEPQIERRPQAVDFSKYFEPITSIPKFDPTSTNPWQVDLRSNDLSSIDMTGSLDDLLYATFDSKTQWPPAARMPGDFDWQQIMEIGKDPGLEIRALHQQGITGKGIAIAIIDQTLLVDHIEYKDQLRLYEEMDDITDGWLEPQMHGPAVASIAVGKSIGVAPDADLYYIATANCSQGTYESNDFACLAKAVRRIIEINKGLPAERKIRVLSMSIGWDAHSKGYDEITTAVKEAQAEGIFVLSTSLSQTYGLNFHGLGRHALAEPNDFTSYQPGLWWQDQFYSGSFSSADTLLVPMDSRTMASPTGTEDFVFYRSGGWSWAVPYLAGMYALAAQVNPDITPQEFWQTALTTGETIHLQQNGKDYKFGVILDPPSLIEAISPQ
jgi:hypothetical protein